MKRHPESLSALAEPVRGTGGGLTASDLLARSVLFGGTYCCCEPIANLLLLLYWWNLFRLMAWQEA
jgi:hypothetical protein